MSKISSEYDKFSMPLTIIIIIYCLLIIGIIIGCGNDNVADTTVNHPPNIPSNPLPPTGATDVETNPQLAWQCSDQDGDSLTYNLYFGISLDLFLLESGLTQEYYNSGQLEERTTYYWKIVAKDIHNDTTAGPIWHFSTTGNLPPAIPSDPNPPDGAANQDTSIQLSWLCTDPEEENLTYDIYFGIDSIPPLLDSNLVFNIYNASHLQYSTTYYWKIIAYDGHQHQTEGPLWNFETRPEPDSVILVGSYDTPGYAHGVFVDDSYAYIADGAFGLWIINISDPYNPSFEGNYNTPGFSSDVFVINNYAYIADGTSGLQIINISNPQDPSYAGNYDTPGYSHDVFVYDNYAYIADGDSGLQIIDVYDPSSPLFEGDYDTPGDAQGVFVSGYYTYIADGTSGLQIIDISDPEIPSYVGSYDTPGEAHDVYVLGDYAFVADGYTGGLQIINVLSPSNPTFENSYNTPGTAWSIFVSGFYAYVADFDGGLQILNIYEPTIPELVANYITAGYAYSVFTFNGYIYAACHDAGLQVLIVE